MSKAACRLQISGLGESRGVKAEGKKRIAIR